MLCGLKGFRVLPESNLHAQLFDQLHAGVSNEETECFNKV